MATKEREECGDMTECGEASSENGLLIVYNGPSHISTEREVSRFGHTTVS
jgi:hypothetical protein